MTTRTNSCLLDCLQSAFYLKICPVLIPTGTIVNNDVRREKTRLRAVPFFTKLHVLHASPMEANGEAASRDKRNCSQFTSFFFKAYQHLVLVSLEKGKMGVRNRGKNSSFVLLTLPEICLSLLLSHIFHLLGNVWTRQLCRNLKIKANNTN